MALALEGEIEQGLGAGHRLDTKDDLRSRFGVAPATESCAGSLGLDVDVDAEAPLAEWREIRDSLEPLVCRKVARRRGADLDLDPAFGKRGDEIKIYVTCDFTVGTLESDMLEDIEVARGDDAPFWRYRGRTKVLADAPEGEHTVRIRCGDDVVEEAFFVIVDGDGRGGTQVTVYPDGAPQTGGGPAGASTGAFGVAGLAGFGTLPGARSVRRAVRR